MRLPGVGRLAPGDEFTFTEAMAVGGCDPEMWITAGNAEFIPEGVVLPPAPKELDEPLAVADAESPPVGRRKGKKAWEALTADPVDDEEAADASDTWAQ
jgi:hypothetical protein